MIRQLPKTLNAKELRGFIEMNATSRKALKISSQLSESDIIANLRQGYYLNVCNRYGVFKDSEDLNQRFIVVAKWFTEEVKPLGLLMMGKTGNGKTTMLRAIQLFVNHAGIIDPYTKIPCKIVLKTADDIANMCKYDYNAFRKLCDEPFLAIDDMGREPGFIKDFGTTLTPIISIIQHRYEQMRPTLCTTNLDWQGILDTYGSRILDRMREMMYPVIFENGSYRGNVYEQQIITDSQNS